MAELPERCMDRKAKKKQSVEKPKGRKYQKRKTSEGKKDRKTESTVNPKVHAIITIIENSKITSHIFQSLDQCDIVYSIFQGKCSVQ